MRVIHIIPAAFNYFDDLKSFVFKVVDLQNEYDVESNAITLQYGSSDVKKDRNLLKEKKKLAKTKKDLPKYDFKGVKSIEEAVEDFKEFDVVHMHVPFFGAGKLILNWKTENPDIPLVITYYYNFITTDFFSLIIKLYNKYYVPKLLKIANLVTDINQNDVVKHKKKSLTNFEIKVKLNNEKFRVEMANKMLLSYLTLIKNNK